MLIQCSSLMTTIYKVTIPDEFLKGRARQSLKEFQDGPQSLENIRVRLILKTSEKDTTANRPSAVPLALSLPDSGKHRASKCRNSDSP